MLKITFNTDTDKKELKFKTEGKAIVISNVSGIIYYDDNGQCTGYIDTSPKVGSINFSIGNNKNEIISQWVVTFATRFNIKDFRDLTTFAGADAYFTLPESKSEPEPFSDNSFSLNNLRMKAKNDTKLDILYITDRSSTNLGEMYSKVTSNHSYPNGFPKKLIGYRYGITTTNTQAIDTFYSFNPKLSKVLKLEGDSLLDQTNKINKEFNKIKINNYQENWSFFNSILAYSTLRYMFAGLSNKSIFSRGWLYSNNYKKFLKKLKKVNFLLSSLYLLNLKQNLISVIITNIIENVLINKKYIFIKNMFTNKLIKHKTYKRSIIIKRYPEREECINNEILMIGFEPKSTPYDGKINITMNIKYKDLWLDKIEEMMRSHHDDHSKS